MKDRVVGSASRSRLTVIVLAVSVAFGASAQSILKVAGGGLDGRPATAVGINPKSAAIDSDGNVFFADSSSHRVRRIDRATGIVTTVAGNGSTVFTDQEEGVPGLSASLNSPYGVAFDPWGHLHVADTFHNRVRRVDSDTGIITTVAGVGSFGFGGDGGPATGAQLNRPEGLAFDASGNLFIGDRNNHRVRRVDASSGLITTVAGNGSTGFSADGIQATLASLDSPVAITVDGDGNLFIADTSTHRIRRVDSTSGLITTVVGTGAEGFGGDGGLATAAQLASPGDVAIDRWGDLWIADSSNLRVRRVDASSGIITTVAGDGSWGFAGDGGPAIAASFKAPAFVSVGVDRTLVIVDDVDNRIRSVDAATGFIETVGGNGRAVFTGDGGLAEHASFAGPTDVLVDPDGNLLIADRYQQAVRRIESSTGVISTIAGGRWGSSGDGGPATEAGLKWPGAIALDAQGNLYIGDRADGLVRRVDPAGMIHAFAGGGEVLGDGGPATLASLASPDGLAVDRHGNLFIADSGSHRVRRIDASTGVISTVAGTGEPGLGGDSGPATQAMLDSPFDVVVDESENLLIVDAGNHAVRRVEAGSGLISTVAGMGESGFSGDEGAATEASLTSPRAIAIDEEGNLLVADTWNHRIRRIDASSMIITTIAGIGALGYRGDGGPASRASLSIVEGLFVDEEGTIFLAERYANRIREIRKCVDVSPPLPASPSDGSQGLSTSPALGWGEVAGAFRYDVYLDSSDPPTRRVAIDIETTVFSPANLQPLTTYYWKVVAKGDPFCEPFRVAESEVWSFATTSECDVPGAFE